MSLTPSVLLKPPAPAPHGSEPPGAPPDTPFATVLDDHQARTAAAEGRQTQPQGVAARHDGNDASRPAGPDDARSADRAAHDGAATDAGSSGARDRAPDDPRAAPAAAALAALLGGMTLPAGLAPAIVATLPAAPAGAEPSAATASDLPGMPAAAAPAQPAAMPTDPAIPARASALPLGAGVVEPASDAAAAGAGPSAAAPAPGARAGLPSAAEALRALATRSAALDAGLAAKVAAAAAASAATAPAPARPAAGVAAHPATAGGAQPAAATAAPTPIVAAPAGGTAGAQAVVQADSADAARGVVLEHAVETVRLALRAAADSGVTHARISLNPRELGSIEVHLRQTADGLVARVVAQHAAAAQLLQHAGADLRRSLESQGLTLLRLDIGASGEQGGRQAPANGGAAGEGAAAGNGAGTADDPLGASEDAAETTATATLALPNGALVDVLA